MIHERDARPRDGRRSHLPKVPVHLSLRIICRYETRIFYFLWDTAVQEGGLFGYRMASRENVPICYQKRSIPPLGLPANEEAGRPEQFMLIACYGQRDRAEREAVDSVGH